MAGFPASELRRSADQPEAFVAFYEHYFQGVLGYVARRVQDPDVAFDLTAETFAQAYSSRRKFRGEAEEQAAAWIYRIASRQLSRHRRHGRAELRTIERLQIELPALDAERRAAIDDLAERDRLQGVLRSGLADVSAEQQTAIGLRVLEDLPYAEVADRLQISEQAARARVSRGLKALATALEDKQPMKEIP